VTKETYIEFLRSLRACNEAIRWTKDDAEGETFAEIWGAATESAWMVWLIALLVDPETIVLLGCRVARSTLHHVPRNQVKFLAALNIAERWAEGGGGVDSIDLRAAYRDVMRAIPEGTHSNPAHCAHRAVGVAVKSAARVAGRETGWKCYWAGDAYVTAHFAAMAGGDPSRNGTADVVRESFPAGEVEKLIQAKIDKEQ
jgi:hypothetical protein